MEIYRPLRRIYFLGIVYDGCDTAGYACLVFLLLRPSRLSCVEHKGAFYCFNKNCKKRRTDACVCLFFGLLFAWRFPLIWLNVGYLGTAL